MAAQVVQQDRFLGFLLLSFVHVALDALQDVDALLKELRVLLAEFGVLVGRVLHGPDEGFGR